MPRLAGVDDQKLPAFRATRAAGRMPAATRKAYAGGRISNADLVHISKLPSLRQLDLSSCSAVDDGAVTVLAAMKNLKFLTIRGTKISDGGAEQIDDALPDCYVDY